jgi:NADP-dependent 3-hydroxy acid dehydrogenase YdfG
LDHRACYHIGTIIEQRKVDVPSVDLNPRTNDLLFAVNLDDLRVAITGAARDTGLLLAQTFAERGAHVYLSARDLPAARHAAEVITRRGPGRADAFRCDLAEPDSVRAFAHDLAARTQHLDVLINNGAGYVMGHDLADASDDQIQQLMAASATGTTLLTKHLLPLLRASTRADIVNMISACAAVGHHHACISHGPAAIPTLSCKAKGSAAFDSHHITAPAPCTVTEHDAEHITTGRCRDGEARNETSTSITVVQRPIPCIRANHRGPPASSR